jgi:hypothetical protein
MTPLQETPRSVLSDKALELFAAYDVPCSPSVAPPEISRQLCGTLGFWLEIETEAGLELVAPTAESEIAAEGEAMLF